MLYPPIQSLLQESHSVLPPVRVSAGAQLQHKPRVTSTRLHLQTAVGSSLPASQQISLAPKSHFRNYSLKTRSERDTCTPMFITALFIIARTWKQPRCPSADEWIRKLWYIYTMEYYSAIKKKSSESVLMRWMKLEPIIQSEVSQKVKDQYSILTHIYGI